MYRLRKWETFDNVLCNGRDKFFNCFLVYHNCIVKKADEILNSSVFSKWFISFFHHCFLCGFSLMVSSIPVSCKKHSMHCFFYQQSIEKLHQDNIRK